MAELSPTAQAVLDAAYSELDYVPQRHVRWCAAAALRAVAHEVAPFSGGYPMNEYMEEYTEGFRNAKQSVHYQLNAIADELENHQ